MCWLCRPPLLDTFWDSGSWSSSEVSNTRTSHGHTNLARIILTCWLLTCFLFRHLQTVPRVVNPGKTALVTALLTATVSSRLTGPLRLSDDKICHHIDGYEASGSSDVSFISSGVYSTQDRVDVTPSTLATFSAVGELTSFTRIFAKRISSNAGPSTPRYV